MAMSLSHYTTQHFLTLNKTSQRFPKLLTVQHFTKLHNTSLYVATPKFTSQSKKRSVKGGHRAEIPKRKIILKQTGLSTQHLLTSGRVSGRPKSFGEEFCIAYRTICSMFSPKWFPRTSIKP